MPVTVHPDSEFPAAAAAFLAERIRDAVTAGGECALALAGGSTPRPVYRRLAEMADVPWTRVSIFFGDERSVPPEHPESNFGMATESLLQRVPVTPDRVHRMEAEREDLEGAAAEYAESMPDVLDLLLLGIGEDGHTASLFPGSPALGESRRKVVPAGAPVPPRLRLTITPAVIRDARLTVVLASGSRKAGAVRCALGETGDPRECPARLARGGHWLLDREAAEALEP